MPRGRKPGSKNKPKKLSPEAKEALAHGAKYVGYVMTPDLEAAIENAIVESPNPPRIEDHPFPSDWDKMGKVDRLKWLKNKH